VRTSTIIGLGVAALAIVGGSIFVLTKADPESAARGVCVDGALSVAVVGDIMLGSDTTPITRVAGETSTLLKSSNVTLGSLGMSLLDQPDTAEIKGPKGGSQHAELFRLWGFSAFARANDYAALFGREGLQQTDNILREANIAWAGTGADLAAARTAGRVKTACGDVAIIGVAVYAGNQNPNAALPPRTGIAGRPGINPLRFTSHTQLDPASYAKMLEANAKIGGPAPDADGTLRAFGMVLRPGEINETTTVMDPDDQTAVLGAIAEARKTAALVIVSIYNDASGDEAGEPAPLVETFARESIGAGAGLVIGHGSHAVRAVEFHRGALIAYGLGDFIADRRNSSHLPPGSYDTSAVEIDEPTPQGAILAATFRDGQVISARLTSLNLASTAEVPEGFPRLGDTAEVLSAIEAVSATRGAKLTVQGGIADLTPMVREPSR